MDPLEQTKLRSLMTTSSGLPEVVIGIIDGPVDFSHPDFEDCNIRTVRGSQYTACKSVSSIACIHGTFIAGVLSGKRERHSPSICPNCNIIIYPIFTDDSDNNNNNTFFIPSSTPKELARAIVETVNAGAKIINLSIGLSISSLTLYQELQEAYNYASGHGTIIVIAAGNQGNIGYTSILNHSWPIPVASCDEFGMPDFHSNFGSSIGSSGLMAPGVNVTSTSAGGGYRQMSGTSISVPFVTGAIALLCSIFPKATTEEIIYSVRMISSFNGRSMIPPILDAEAAVEKLKTLLKV
jgi:subtilisin family serine protease